MNQTASLKSLVRSRVVFECPAFVVRSKDGFKESLSKMKDVVELDPPVTVIGNSPEGIPVSTLEVKPRITFTTKTFGLQEKKTTFTLTPSQVAASDYHTLSGLPWDDQKFLVALMPWDRVASLVLHLKSQADASGPKNLLILCNLRLEKLGIGPLPDGWTTSNKVPILPGYSPSFFTPFSNFEMVEVPFYAKSLTDVKNVAEKLISLKTSLNISEGPSRLFLRFEPRNQCEERLISETKKRGILFAFSTDPVPNTDDRSHYNTAATSISWTVEVTFAASIDNDYVTETISIHDVLETMSVSKMVREAVQRFGEHNKLGERFRPAILDNGTRSIDVLLSVPRIATAKFNLERYQRIKHDESLMENLEDKVVVDRPKFLVVFKDQSSKFSSKFMTSAQENALIDFVHNQKVFTKPRNVGTQYLNLFDHLHSFLSNELILLREDDVLLPPVSIKARNKKSKASAALVSEANATKSVPYELAFPVNVKYGVRRVLPSRDMTFIDMKNAEDMVAMAMHRKLEDVIKPLRSSRAESFISRVAQYWGFRVKEIVTVEAAITRMVVYFEGLSRLVTLAECQDSAIASATAGAYSGVMAALCYMLVVPFEMWNAVTRAASDEWIDAIIYACRRRFAHLLLMSHSDEFLKLSEFNGTFDNVIPDNLLALWQLFIHKMRHTGIRFWTKNRDIQIPNGVTTPDLSKYPGTYFRFSAFEGIIDWAAMNPITNKNETSDIIICEPTVFDRFSEQDYERGLLPSKAKDPNVHRCPVTGAENWHETITALPDDPHVQITARDCETRGDEVCTRWQSAINHLLIEQISRRFNWKVVYTHLIQWESNSQFANFFHLVNVKFDNIAPFFLQGLGKHVYFRRAVEIADSFIVSSLCRMGVIPLEMYDLIREIGEEWIDPVLYSCRERFAAFLRLSKNPAFFELNTLARAELSAAHADATNFAEAYEFARYVRDSALRYWSAHQLVVMPKSIVVPQTEFASLFFTFANIEGFEKWDEFSASTTEFDHKSALLPLSEMVPPWEKGNNNKIYKKISSATLPISDAYKEFRDADLDPDDVPILLEFMDDLADNISCKIQINKRVSRTRKGFLLYHCEVKFSGDTGDFLYGKASSEMEALAYERAIRELYANLLNCGFVVPSLNKFVVRCFPKEKRKDTDDKEVLPSSRIPYVARAIRPLLQRFGMIIKRFRALVTGCDKTTKKMRCEQMLSLTRRLNESSWKSHPVLLPFNIFVDYKDTENCRHQLQSFFEVLEPNTVWIGSVKAPEGVKKNPYSNCEYALTINDLQAEKVTVSFGEDYGVAKEEKDPDGGSLTETGKSAGQMEKSQSPNAQGETTPTIQTNKITEMVDLLIERSKKQLPEEDQPAISLPWQELPDSTSAQPEHGEDDEEDEYLD